MWIKGYKAGYKYCKHCALWVMTDEIRHTCGKLMRTHTRKKWGAKQ